MKSLRERFEDKYVPEPNSGCWLWTASENKSGYGQIWVYEFGRAIVAHRASYMLFVGDIPEGMDVLHKCDTPCCVNPDHLFLGDSAVNLLDMTTKGRGRKSKKGLPPHIYERNDGGPCLYYAVISINRKRITSRGFRSMDDAVRERDRLRLHGRTVLDELSDQINGGR